MQKIMQGLVNRSHQTLQRYVNQCVTKKSSDFCAQLDTAYQAGMDEKRQDMPAEMKELNLTIPKFGINAKTRQWQSKHADEAAQIRKATISKSSTKTAFTRLQNSSDWETRVEQTTQTIERLWQQK
ncbi:hypothetical protein QDY71_07590 [Kingella negevensis]|uniref:Uncharacterized protein n=1 Tax=Kingella negevensis TaxID=1522312 RepID=A0A238HFY6_9NEIS|nr:hypothetical protein [Kingella negevensis]MDK4684345.1 hypothetical protein [Kingella negevensis]MDK4697611.1 hypothetical protein [Kingella negevensis]MDK4706883.1 hypothetical protein [Kingella negevensis]MDK4710463.1 hypothetical protein [Kingella negevensis]SNB61568.1 Uncharacterised protein [Kingella negevensis]